MFISELASALLGLIVGVILQDPITRLYRNIKKWFRKVFYRLKPNKENMTDGCFILGSRNTSVYVLDGDGYRAFLPQNIEIDIVDGNKDYGEYAEEVNYFYRLTVEDLETRRKNGEDALPWDGATLSLAKYAISRTADSEEFRIRITLATNTYYYTFSVINHLNDICPATGRQMARYIEDYQFQQSNKYHLPNSVGVCFQVVTKDYFTVFSRRASSSGFRPGESDCSIVEGLNQQDISNHSINLEEVALRAFQEEICDARKEELEISILGLVFDKQYNQWNFIGLINCGLTQKDIIRRRNSGTSGKWELTIDFIQMDLKKIMVFLSSHKMWDMGLVTLYFSLIQGGGFSKKKIDQMISSYLPR